MHWHKAAGWFKKLHRKTKGNDTYSGWSLVKFCAAKQR